MFVIEVDGQKHVWQNHKSEDFLQFVPMHFAVSHDELTIYYVSDDMERRKLEVFRNKDESHVLDFSETGKVKKTKLMEETSEIEGAPPVQYLEVIEVVELTRLTEWPYDAENNFKGIP